MYQLAIVAEPAAPKLSGIKKHLFLLCQWDFPDIE